MFPFRYAKAADEQTALRAAAAGARFIAGGTMLVDLMRETVERPDSLVDINGLPYTTIDVQPGKIYVGSLVRTSDLALILWSDNKSPCLVSPSSSAPRLSCATWLRSAGIYCNAPGACTSATCQPCATGAPPAPAARR